MPLTWRQRIAQQPHLADVTKWPEIALDSLPKNKRKAFLRNRRIVASVLAGKPSHNVARDFGLSTTRVNQLLNRALGGDEHEQPPLNRGLIPYEHLQDKRCRVDLQLLTSSSTGACQFRGLLARCPEVVTALDQLIKDNIRPHPKAQRLTPQRAHKLFLQVLRDHNWPADRYPFTSESQAYESVRLYLHRRDTELRASRIKPQRQDFSVKRTMPGRALRAIQIDEHTMDLRAMIRLALNDELFDLPVKRASVLVAKDVDTSCVLAHLIAYTGHPNQQDLLNLLNLCVTPWKPMTLTTPGLHYPEGSCMPNGLDEYPISFGLVQLDNALMHLAKDVVECFCEQMGATLEHGYPDNPSERDSIEHQFDDLREKVTQRFDSTTGSYPTDPIKESRKNQKRVPIVSMRIIEETFSVYFADYNTTEQAVLGAAAPLDHFKHQSLSHYIRYVPKEIRSTWAQYLCEKTVKIHWYKHRHQRPHINFMHGRYKGAGLEKALLAGESEIRIRYDRCGDAREIEAMRLDGTPLGTLKVSATWQRYPHTIATRARIHKHNRKQRFSRDDPLTGYFMHLMKHKDRPNSAMEILRVYSEFSQGETPEPIILPDEHQTVTESPQHRSSKYKWSTKYAKRST